MSNLEGLFVMGEANFSDHGANRLGASALMQGLADGYFVLPYTIPHYLANLTGSSAPSTDDQEFVKAEEAVKERTEKLLANNGKQSVKSFHKRLGNIMWDHCGMARTKEKLEEAIKLIPELRKEFWQDVRVPGEGKELNQSLESAGRVGDFLELGELMCRDALTREESCGGHFREEYQYEDGEAMRDDENFAHVAAWEYKGEDQEPVRHTEELEYESVKFATRSYK
jgi:succinate dehydrogenase / fumarate reductase flavoprotein subunit